jgi:DNA excision repair protein ERCC-2
MLQFCRVGELFDEHYLFDISKRDLERSAKPLATVPA